MSDTEHATSGQSLTKKILTLAVLVGLPLAVVLGLIDSYKSHDSGVGVTDMSEQAVMARLQKVGYVSLGQASHEPKTGEQVFKAQCTTCHAAGLLGAPKFGDAAAWAPRIKSGYDALLKSALKGKGNMTPQGGGAFADDEVGRALVYMANAGGAKFDEPKAPTAAASASK